MGERYKYSSRFNSLFNSCFNIFLMNYILKHRDLQQHFISRDLAIFQIIQPQLTVCLPLEPFLVTIDEFPYFSRGNTVRQNMTIYISGQYGFIGQVIYDRNYKNKCTILQKKAHRVIAPCSGVLVCSIWPLFSVYLCEPFDTRYYITTLCNNAKN